jgi:Uma2 family endonuclease
MYGRQMATITQLITAEEFEQLPGSERTELIDGVVFEMSPPGYEHSGIAGTVVGLLFAYAEPEQLGRPLTDPGVIIRRHPDTVRAPDAAFILAERIPPEGLPKGFWNVVPDLVVEVVSPYDSASEVQVKIREWLEAGARLLWIIYPSRKVVNVIRSLADREELGIGDVLDGGDVLPGFTCRVARLFA